MLKGQAVVSRPSSNHYKMTRKESECCMQLLFNVFLSLSLSLLVFFSGRKSFGPKAGLGQKNRVDGFLPVVNLVSKRYVQNIQHCSGTKFTRSSVSLMEVLSLFLVHFLLIWLIILDAFLTQLILLMCEKKGLWELEYKLWESSGYNTYVENVSLDLPLFL